MRRDNEEFKKWITEEIKRFVREDLDNRLKLDSSFIFEEPLVGFVAGNDPIFYQLKEVIGEFHLTPHEAMSKIAEKRGVSVSEEEIGVVSYILPISKKTREENAKMKEMPSERWAHTRLFGENFNKKLQRHLVSLLEEEGYFAVAPQTEKELFETKKDDKVGYASTWSQRHVAFAAGLGTFGLSDGLITKAGKAHRCGSVVVNQPLDSPQRREINETTLHWDCLFYQNEGCMQCAERCPVGAISEVGHDKDMCREYIFSKTADFVKENYGIDIYGCGLCQTDVVCEEESPVNKEK
ncbi:MAG: epoxyqueuosine reductase [Promethearchaeota archaeon]